ncbi:hypothetical protein ACFL0I_05585 [Gemmatimonadota bacterium]
MNENDDAPKNPTRRRNTLHDIFAAARDDRLTNEELRVWLLFRYHDFKDKGTFVGAETVGLEAGMSRRTVERHRSALVKRGFLTQKLRGPKPAVYKAVIPPEDYADVAEQGGEETGKVTQMNTQECVSQPTQICPPNTGGGDTGEYFSSSNELPGADAPVEFSEIGGERVDIKERHYALLDRLNLEERRVVRNEAVGSNAFPAERVSASMIARLPIAKLEELEARVTAREKEEAIKGEAA